MKRIIAHAVAAAFLLAALPIASAAVQEKTSSVADRSGVAVTIYNDNLALIKDSRRVVLDFGLNLLALRDVSAQIRPETAALVATDNGPLKLLEQNFDFDLLSPQKLLDKHVGRQLTVIHTNPATGLETRENATVLATNSGTVLRFDGRIETGVPGRLSFASVPDTLRDRPTLVVHLETSAAGRRELELSYLTGGLSWRADYVADLQSAGTALDLNGWVTLSNSSGASYDQARLQLVAGTVNRARPKRSAPEYLMAARQAPAPAPAMQEESLFEYHLYTLDRPTTLADNQTKQVALLTATGIPVRRQYVLAGAEYYYRGRYGLIGEKIKPAVYLEFENSGGGLGRPLPKGIVRVYMKDSRGNGQFVGEDAIEHSARGEKIKLRMGEAFDITAEKKQTQYRKIAEQTHESSYRIELRNAKDEEITVLVEESLSGDWEILSQSQAHEKASARLARWAVPVPARGTAVLEFSVRQRW